MFNVLFICPCTELARLSAFIHVMISLVLRTTDPFYNNEQLRKYVYCLVDTAIPAPPNILVRSSWDIRELQCWSVVLVLA